MINKTILGAVTSACVIGFGTSLLLRSSQSDQAIPTQSDQENVTISKSERKPSDRPTTTRTPGLEELLADWSGRGSNERRGKADKMDLDEHKALLQAFSSAEKSSYDVTDGFDVLLDSLKSLSARDPDAAVEWVLSLETENDRRYLLSLVVGVIGETNFEEGLMMQENLAKAYGQSIKLPFSQIAEAASKDANALVRLFSVSAIREVDEPMVYPVREYAKDFDFETALNGLADLQATFPKGEHFGLFPADILEQWAKRDPERAMEWALSEKEILFNTGIRDFMAGYKMKASDAEMVEMVSKIYAKDEGYDSTWKALSGAGNEAVVQGFIEKAASGGGSNQLLAGLLSESMGEMRMEDQVARQMLLGNITAEQRMEIFIGKNAPKPPNPEADTRLRIELSGLGHTPEEIDRMMPPIIAESE